MDMSLYRVGASGRIALGDLATGVEFYTAEQADNGVITLTPIRVVAATGKRAVESTPEPADPVATSDPDGETTEDDPWK